MGKDSVEPFLSFDNKYVFLLSLTSNLGSEDFQLKEISKTSNKLYEDVISTSKTWENSNKIMYVVGAKNVKEISKIRKLVPNSYLLIPGVGAQGGSLKDICENGLDNGLKLLVNSSRSIIYSSNDKDYASKAMEAASKLQYEMNEYMIEKGLI
jgi:orotidine-5'-phosphate decarboxylase